MREGGPEWSRFDVRGLSAFQARVVSNQGRSLSPASRQRVVDAGAVKTRYRSMCCNAQSLGNRGLCPVGGRA